jgi:hypothetical protein
MALVKCDYCGWHAIEGTVEGLGVCFNAIVPTLEHWGHVCFAPFSEYVYYRGAMDPAARGWE